MHAYQQGGGDATKLACPAGVHELTCASWCGPTSHRCARSIGAGQRTQLFNMRLRRSSLLPLLLPRLCGVVDAAVSTASKLIIVTGANSGIVSNLLTICLCLRTSAALAAANLSVLGPEVEYRRCPHILCQSWYRRMFPSNNLVEKRQEVAVLSEMYVVPSVVHVSRFYPLSLPLTPASRQSRLLRIAV